MAGNQPELTKKSVGIVEKKEIGDLTFNEVMFENPETSLEYIEIYNKSDKLLDVSGMIFTTRKTDGTMNTGVIIPKNTSPLPPKGYLAICSKAIPFGLVTHELCHFTSYFNSSKMLSLAALVNTRVEVSLLSADHEVLMILLPAGQA